MIAFSATARGSLVGRGDRLLDQPIYRAAADCLGDVIAARLVPERLLLSVEFGVDLIAVGVGQDRREVLCVLGGTAERAAEIVDNLRASLAGGAREPRTGEPITDLIEDAQVSSEPYEGIEVVRAELRRASGQPPGLVFAAVSRGSVVELITGT